MARRCWIVRVTAAALMVVFALILPVASVTSVAQQAGLPQFYLNVGTANNTIVAETVFYKLIVNASNCLPIAYYAKTQSGATVNLTGSPGGIVVAYSNSTAHNVIVEWRNVTVEDLGEGASIIHCRDPANAPNSLSAEIILNQYYPFIDVVVNPAPGVISVGFTLNPSLNWSAAVSYYNNSRLVAERVEGEGSISYGPIDGYALMSSKNISGDTILLLATLRPLPGYNTPLNIGVYNASEVNGTGLLATLDYTFDDTVGGVIGVRATLGVYSAYAAAASGALGAVLELHPQASDDVRSLAYFERLVEQLNNTISALRDNIEKLAERNQNLTKKLEEYKGCELTWKSEVEVLKQRCDRLESTVKSAGIRTVGAFGAGIILGLIGGLLAIERKAGRLRR